MEGKKESAPLNKAVALLAEKKRLQFTSENKKFWPTRAASQSACDYVIQLEVVCVEGEGKKRRWAKMRESTALNLDGRCSPARRLSASWRSIGNARELSKHT